MKSGPRILVAVSLLLAAACGKDKDVGGERFEVPSKQEIEKQAVKIIADAEDGIELAQTEVDEAFTALEAASTAGEKTAATTRVKKAREDLSMRQAGLRSLKGLPPLPPPPPRDPKCEDSSDPLCGL